MQWYKGEIHRKQFCLTIIIAHSKTLDGYFGVNVCYLVNIPSFPAQIILPWCMLLKGLVCTQGTSLDTVLDQTVHIALYVFVTQSFAGRH